MKIKHKLVAVFIAVSLLVGLVGFLGLYANNHIVNSFKSGEEHFGSIIEASNEVSSYAKRAEGHLMLYLTLHNESDKQKFFMRLASLREQNSIMDEKVNHPEARKILDDINSKTDKLQSTGESLLQAHDNEIRTTGRFEIENHRELIRNLDDAAAEIREDGLNLAMIEVKLRTEQDKTAQKNAAYLYNIIFIICVSAIFGALALGYVMAKNIADPVMRLKDAAVGIGKGNLDTKIEIKSNNEIGELAEEFNKMAEDLKVSNDEIISARKYTDNIIHSMTDTLITVSPNGTIQTVNPAACALLGYREDEFIGKHVETVFADKKELPFDMLRNNDLFKKEPTRNIEKTYKAKDGRKILMSFSSSAIHDNNGMVQGAVCVAQDITERKKAEMALQESEERYRKLVELSPDGIFIHSEGKIVFSNTAGAKLLGAEDVGQLIGKQVMDFIHPDYREIAREGIRQMSEDERDVFLAERKSLRLDGSIIDVEMAVMPFTYLGKPAVQVIIRDITERKQAVEKLKLFSEAVEKAPDGVQIVNLDGHIIYSNMAIKEIYGFSPEEYRGKHVDEMNVDPEFASSVILPAIKKTGRWVGELMVKHKDGRAFPIWLTTSLVKDRVGEPMAIVAIIRDITEHKRADEKIREQASLLDKAQDAIYVEDLEHNIIFWNKSAQRLYGWTAEEVTGKDADRILYKKEIPGLIEAKKNVIEKEEWTGELCQVTRDGKDIIVESRWTLTRDSEGKAKSILIINTDITEKKRLESQLLRAQRMESIGTLASGVAHDINNVLLPIMLSLELLQEKFKDDGSQKLISIIERSAHRGADLIKQVQSFSRGIEGERKALQVMYLISEIRQLAKETFPRNIEVKADTPENLWTICGDATQLHQVLMNLCVNARDAMPEGGILGISAENISIDESVGRINVDARIGPYVMIAVSDTGTGIPAKTIDRIFDPFFTTKAPGKGTGLGLSIALTIVKSHSGFINVNSEVGKGSTFRVYLPAITTATAQKKHDQSLEFPIGHGEYILVVDDEAQIREITRVSLEKNGYRVLTASDGAEAIPLYSQNRDKIKIVLMDMMMPVMDGPASINGLREIDPGVMIIAVSGLTESDKYASITGKVHAFLSKPYTTERLLKTIHEVLNVKHLS